MLDAATTAGGAQKFPEGRLPQDELLSVRSDTPSAAARSPSRAPSAASPVGLQAAELLAPAVT
jgi:hypothetical protein